MLLCNNLSTYLYIYINLKHFNNKKYFRTEKLLIIVEKFDPTYVIPNITNKEKLALIN
jgi:hypothetical protein